VTAQGRSRGYVNGRSVPMQTLSETGERLVDICGQQAHQSLQHRSEQRALLDSFGGHLMLTDHVTEAYGKWQASQARLDTLTQNRQELDARHDLLKYQVGELNALALQPGEFATLDKELLRIANTGRISATVEQALNRLYESDQATARDIISRTRTELIELSELDDSLQSPADLLSEAEILITEATDALRRHGGQLQPDPARQAQLEQRLGSAQELARKHRVTPDELPALAETLNSQLLDLDTRDERIEQITGETATLLQTLTSVAEKLTQARTSSAELMTQRVTENMQGLGMPGGRFEVSLGPAANGPISQHGSDHVEFTVTANPGQAAGPLNRVASGGELSRISLALQVVAMAAESVPTLIFDEVDSGVGGGVAEIVGKELRELGQQRQVLCVTHLAQVASQGGQHLRVSKISDGVATRTSVKPLTARERIEEVARMLGGVKITGRTRDHAEEMLGTAVKETAG